MKKFKFRINQRKTGRILKYVEIEGKNLDDACERLLDKLGTPHSVRDTIRNPIVYYVRDADGKYRAP